jgi:hypothetical protein
MATRGKLTSEDAEYAHERGLVLRRQHVEDGRRRSQVGGPQSVDYVFATFGEPDAGGSSIAGMRRPLDEPLALKGVHQARDGTSGRPEGVHEIPHDRTIIATAEQGQQTYTTRRNVAPTHGCVQEAHPRRTEAGERVEYLLAQRCVACSRRTSKIEHCTYRTLYRSLCYEKFITSFTVADVTVKVFTSD